MNVLKLKVITPRKVVLEQDILSITAPGSAGECTILPQHAPLFTMLDEGIIRFETPEGEKFMTIGGGYLETDGTNLHLLVSRAYGQAEIDEEEVKRAKAKAEELLENVQDEHERQQLMKDLHRSLLDLKLLQKVRSKNPQRRM